MHTIIDQPLTAMDVGRISCRPMGLEPIDFEWSGPGNAPVETDPSGSEALRVGPGRYRVVAVDATGSRADIYLDVEPTYPDALVVREYRVSPASTGSARDGSVEAVGYGLHGMRFLWTNGVETTGPTLRDVPCGTYACVPMPKEDGTLPTLVHQCAPARVTVA
jgi:hypothetical protein